MNLHSKAETPFKVEDFMGALRDKIRLIYLTQYSKSLKAKEVQAVLIFQILVSSYEINHR